MPLHAVASKFIIVAVLTDEAMYTYDFARSGRNEHELVTKTVHFIYVSKKVKEKINVRYCSATPMSWGISAFQL